MRANLIEPTIDQILRYCAEAPVERVFLEDVARRAQGRFAALADEDEELTALCHLGSNVVPSGAGCGAFAGLAAQVGRADADRRGAAPSPISGRRPARSCRVPASTGPASPSTRSRIHRRRETPGLRRGDRWPTWTCSLPSCAAAHYEELGVDPLRRDADGFRWRTRTQIEEGRSWLWAEDGVIRFKAEASAWTPSGGAAAAGVDRSAGPPAGLRGPGASRPDPAAARADADRVPLRPRRERAGDQALRVGRHAPRARLPLRAAVTRAASGRARDPDPRAPRARGLQRRRHDQRHPAGRGALAAGRRGGRGARRPARDGADRARRQLAASGARPRPSRSRSRAAACRSSWSRGLDEIGFGSFEGGSLAAYRAWAWEHAPDAACPGGGETRADAARRFAAGLDALARPARARDPGRHATACRCAT